MKKTIIATWILTVATLNVYGSTLKLDNETESKTTILTGNQEKNYNFAVNHEQLGNDLRLDNDDVIGNTVIYRIYDTFCNGMIQASTSEKTKTKTKLTINSIDYAVKNMRYFLNDYQFHMFLQFLHNKLMYNGFEQEVSMYCDIKN